MKTRRELTYLLSKYEIDLDNTRNLNNTIKSSDGFGSFMQKRELVNKIIQLRIQIDLLKLILL